MKNVPAAILFGLLLLAVMSCSLIDKFASGGQKMNKASELWSDVPRMAGLAQSDLELPLAIKLLLRTALNNLWRLNKEGEDKTPVDGDWIVFTSGKLPADVQNFYTNERMTSAGNWETGKESTCLDGKENGINGVLCVFQKVADKKEILLAIIAMQDDKSKQTNVFFLRLEQDAPSDANKPPTASSNKQTVSNTQTIYEVCG